MKTRIILFGSGTFGLPSFETLRSAKSNDIVAVVSQPARPVGRHRDMVDTPIAQWAQTHQLPLLTPATLRKNDDFFDRLKQLQPDSIVVADYGLIIPQRFLDLSPSGSVNIHASLLPKYRGAAPVVHAILNAEAQTGVTLMVMDAGLDTGPILVQHKMHIQPDMTAVEAEKQLSELAAAHIQTDLAAFLQHQLLPIPQSNADATLAPKISREDGLATWTSATQEYRKILAYTPWPGLWTTWKHWRIKILKATVLPGAGGQPGRVAVEGRSWKIACADGWLAPQEVQFSGGQPRSAEGIPHDYPGFLEARLGSS